jgi:hypothetical protein
MARVTKYPQPSCDANAITNCQATSHGLFCQHLGGRTAGAAMRNEFRSRSPDRGTSEGSGDFRDKRHEEQGDGYRSRQGKDMTSHALEAD